MGIDLNNGYADLLPHVGHDIRCVRYGISAEPPHGPVNVAIECETCGEVLLDYDRAGPVAGDEPGVYGKGCPECHGLLEGDWVNDELQGYHCRNCGYYRHLEDR